MTSLPLLPTPEWKKLPPPLPVWYGTETRCHAPLSFPRLTTGGAVAGDAGTLPPVLVEGVGVTGESVIGVSVIGEGDSLGL